MTAPAVPSLQRLAFGDLEHELASTRRLLERVPDEHWSWRPHPKSSTLGNLATHVASVLGFATGTLHTDQFDLLDPSAAAILRPKASNRAELLALFDATVERARESMAGLGEGDAWFAPWTLRHGAHVVFTQPKLGVLRGAGINHLIHHRAQLGVYLRLLDVPVPGMYGPSADGE
jgi:DinB superfamily